MSKKIAFVLDHKLNHYRVAFFEELSKTNSVTVYHRGPKVFGIDSFVQNVIEYRRFGPFERIKTSLDYSKFDVVIVMQNLRLLDVYKLPLRLTRKKLLLWGIGTSSSKGLGSESIFSFFLRNIVTFFYNGLALYSEVPIKNYWGVNRRKIAVVGNSISNRSSKNTSGATKKYFLFIGSLNKRKGLIELLDSFSRVVVTYPGLQLKLVGEGPEKAAIECRLMELGIENNVELLGPIYDDAEKQKVFSEAYCVISPFQAGLSVVEAFSYGVPFVTSSSAITGGESESIVNDNNGVRFSRIEDLEDIMASFLDGRRSSAYLGNNAFEYYEKHLAFDFYVERFKKFIENYS